MLRWRAALAADAQTGGEHPGHEQRGQRPTEQLHRPDPTGRDFTTIAFVFTFERLRREHFELLGRWLAEPHVSRWWNHDPSPAAVERDFGDTADDDEPAQDYLVLRDGAPIGIIQYCRFGDYPEYVDEMAAVYPVDDTAATIDYLIGERADVGHGVGSAMIRAFVERIWAAEPDVTHVVVPVNSANVASWRALEKAGFHLVAQGELEPDNPSDDHLHEILRFDRPTEPVG